MYIHGEFINKIGEIVSVGIVTKNDRNREIEIGVGSNADIYFTGNPVKIESQVSDTFDVLLMNQATISLDVRNFISDFFCASCFDAVVNIRVAGECVFAGFIEPQTYSQGFNDLYDRIELSCIDVVTALSYRSYKDVAAPKLSYGEAKIESRQRTFRELIILILSFFIKNLDINNNANFSILYDGSKAIDDKVENAHSIFSQLSLFDLLFFGDDEDSIWTADTVLSEILRYLNLHLVQIGFNFYIYSLESLKSVADITWHNIYDDSVTTTQRKEIAINIQNVADDKTKINIGEVYSVLSLTCDTEKTEDIIESPLSDSMLKSEWSSPQKYMREIDTYGEGKTSFSSFLALTHDEESDYDGADLYDWFIQVKHNKNWRIGAKGDDISRKFAGDNKNQHAVPNYLASNPGAAIIAFGNLSQTADKKDNSIKSKIEMENYLVLSVNGNGEDSESGTYPKANDIRAAIPYAEYNGSYTGGVLSPADESSTNYIVISGDIIMNPIPELSGTYKFLHSTPKKDLSVFFGKGRVRTVKRSTGKNCYYTQQFFKAETPFENEVWDEEREKGLVPYFKDRTRKQYEFKFSAIGDKSDKISKISVLACMLIIGDKCVVEVGHTGGISDYQWLPYKSIEACKNEDEYFAQSFTIGFDPKIGDDLIGTSFKIQNNISYKLGIDAEGTAIQIRKSDGIHGRVQFKILGPVNMMWGEVTRRHPTFFRHTKWGVKTIPLLAHVSSIMVKKFEIKIYNDNGHVNNTEDKDLVYMSAESNDFSNKKDDIEFKICSALTAEERREFGVNDFVSMTSPLAVTTSTPITAIYNRCKGERIKPEIDYIDSYYKEYSAPRVILTQALRTLKGVVSPFHLYTHPALEGKKMFVQAVDYDIIEGEAMLILKEIEK